jgi:hypothetical protein
VYDNVSPERIAMHLVSDAYPMLLAVLFPLSVKLLELHVLPSLPASPLEVLLQPCGWASSCSFTLFSVLHQPSLSLVHVGSIVHDHVLVNVFQASTLLAPFPMHVCCSLVAHRASAQT